MLVVGWDLKEGYQLELLHVSSPRGLGFLTTWQLGSNSKYLGTGSSIQVQGEGDTDFTVWRECSKVTFFLKKSMSMEDILMTILGKCNLHIWVKCLSVVPQLWSGKLGSLTPKSAVSTPGVLGSFQKIKCRLSPYIEQPLYSGTSLKYWENIPQTEHVYLSSNIKIMRNAVNRTC